MYRALTLAAAAALAAGCGRGGGGQVAGGPERQAVAADDVTGLSGLSRGDDGELWLVPERDRTLLRMGTDRSIDRYPILGVARGYDLESLAFLGGESFAFGVERNAGTPGTEVGDRALILLAELASGKVTVGDRIEIDTSLWGLNLKDNEGVEGLCRAGGFLVAGIETVGSAGGARFAPLAVYDLAVRRARAYRLRLTSTTGSLSAVACDVRDGRVAIVAVERHFGVLRILRAQLPDAPGEVVPEVIADLDTFADRTRLNAEGIVVGDGGDVTLVVDNHYRGVTGPNELLLVKGLAR